MFVGCESDDPTGSGDTAIAGPSSLLAYSATETSVGLAWTLSPDEGRTDVPNPSYTIRVKDTTGVLLSTLTAVKGQSTLTVTGLTEGTVYLFVIRLNVNAGVVSNDSSSVRWSPAKRRETEGSAPIQVFETASSSFPSGLDVFSAGSNGPVTLSLTGGSNSLIDLYVFTEVGTSDLLIRSASLSSVIGTPKITLFSTTSQNADDLNSPQAAPPAPATYSTLELRVSAAAVTVGKIFFGRTQENNYFRLQVVRNSGSLIFGSSPDRFLTVRISYQSTAGNPYAITHGGPGHIVVQE
ncbi:MAG: fibronectin type III domain-containing protein [Bacteroidota bacterium]